MVDHSEIDGWFYHEELFAGVLSTLPCNARVVEVGSWKGKSASYIASILQSSGGQLWCVDHWRGSDEDLHHEDEDVRAGTLYETFLSNTRGFDCITPLRMASVDGACQFEDRSVDLVYLDAGHEEADVLADIDAWWPKLRHGGWLIGDDWAWPGVRKAVEGTFGDRVVTVGLYPAWVVRKQGAEHGEGHSAKNHGKASRPREGDSADKPAPGEDPEESGLASAY